ncbi:MAG: hypothetical protein ACRDGD_08575 [Candidatus Limnocylindria bacterium]
MTRNAPSGEATHVDLQADGGTHVANTGEIGHICLGAASLHPMEPKPNEARLHRPGSHRAQHRACELGLVRD